MTKVLNLILYYCSVKCEKKGGASKAFKSYLTFKKSIYFTNLIYTRNRLLIDKI